MCSFILRVGDRNHSLNYRQLMGFGQNSNMRWVLGFLTTALLPTISFGQSPIPPNNPILLTTSIGEVAGSNDKITVSVLARVEKNKTLELIQIKDNSAFGGTFEFPSTDSNEISKLLEQAADMLLSNQLFSGQTGKATVAVAEIQGQKGVILKFEVEGSFVARQVFLDADNAASLARILKRAKLVSDWLTTKYSTFHVN